jgi:hypothetical protein
MWQTIATVLRQSWEQFATQALAIAPNILAALFILLCGVIVGWVSARVVHRMVAGPSLRQYVARLGGMGPMESLGIANPASLLAGVVKWLIVLLACIPAFSSLAPNVASDVAYRLLVYAPDLVVGALILSVGSVASGFLARSVLIGAVNHELRSPHLLSSLTRTAIMVIAVTAALEQLGIARGTVLAAFWILFGGATLTLALALGLGGQESVRRWLSGESATTRTDKNDYKLRHW